MNETPSPQSPPLQTPSPSLPPLATAAEAPARAPTAFLVTLRPLTLADPWRWIGLGWRDFLRAPAIGLFYGACFTAMGWALVAVYESAPAYVLALAAGFLLAGPFVCIGLYQVSEALEKGEPPTFAASILAWRRKTDTLAIFGFVLLVLELLWGRASLVVFVLSFDGMPDFKGSLLALLDPKNLNFIVAYVAVGSIFAAVIYAISVVSIPMILDRRTDPITAGLTSVRLVLEQPGVMLVWGALVTVIVVVAMLPGFAGLLVAGPLVGHATWHAYRAAVANDKDDA